MVETSIAGERLAATLLVVFGLMALMLAAVGVYGLMSYSVAQRTGEIAVRSALGASERQLLALVLGRGIRLAVAGIVLGVIGAVAMRQVVAGQLYGRDRLDARVFVVASLALFSVAAVACLLPAQRATRSIRRTCFGSSDFPRSCRIRTGRIRRPTVRVKGRTHLRITVNQSDTLTSSP